jgi:hypothetical protein
VNFGGTTSSNETLVLNKRFNCVDTIINSALSILKKRIGGASENDGSEFILILISTEDCNTGAGNLSHCNLISITELLWGRC